MKKLTKAQQNILNMITAGGILELNTRTACACIKFRDGSVIDVDRRPFDRLCAIGILVYNSNIAGSPHRKGFKILG